MAVAAEAGVRRRLTAARCALGDVHLHAESLQHRQRRDGDVRVELVDVAGNEQRGRHRSEVEVVDVRLVEHEWRTEPHFVAPALSSPVVSASAVRTASAPRSIVFHSTMLSMMPDLMYGRHMLGRESPVTFTSVRPDCLTASAAPGTAGAAIAMITFTFGCTLSTV